MADTAAAPDRALELELHTQGHRLVAGVDECGRGSHGPVAVGVCVVSADLPTPDGITDSKKLTAARRQHAAELARRWAHGIEVGYATAAEVDEHGILAAMRLAFGRALDTLTSNGLRPDAILLDGPHNFLDGVAPGPVTCVVRGDSRSSAIAAASVVAKTERDQLMVDIDRQWPGYGFATHKGYLTKAHQQAIAELGRCEQHRHSWKR